MSIETLTGHFPCTEEGCDRSFQSRSALQGHLTSHRPPQPCPECGKQYKTPGALGNHRKMTHGVPSQTQLSNGTADPVAPRRGRPPKNRIDLDWTTDDIFSTVVNSLWPGGNIPVEAVLPLIQWREMTREFLEKVRQ